MAPSSPRSSGISADDSPEQRLPGRLTKSLRKCLFICWLIIVANIWLASDGSDESLDPSFGDPGREGNNNIVREMERMSGIGGENDITTYYSTEAPDYPGVEAKRDSTPTAKEMPNETGNKLMHEKLVEALQPVTFNKCCVPAVYNETQHPKDVACFGTCYNERACNDPNFPFNSAEEKEMFPMAQDLSKELRWKLKRKCKSPQKLAPPIEWCQKPHAKTKQGIDHLVKGIPPAGCSSISNGGGSGAFQHVILFPAAKLAFCGIPKVGITQWEQFLRFTFGAKDYPAMPHFKLDRKFYQFDALDPNAQRRIWEDEEWTWAAFIRNPAERLLSAYLDKVKSKGKLSWTDGSITFEKFVNSISEPFNSTSCEGKDKSLSGLNWCSDPHWRPQVYSCGMSERLDRFQFIGDLHNAADQTRELLDHVGLWESHGKHFINGGKTVGRSPWCNIVSHPFNHTRHLGFQQKDEVSKSSAAQTVYGHSKGSNNKLDEFFTPELLKKVQEELYPEDYRLWKLVSENGIKLSNGKELMPQLSSKCASAPVKNSAETTSIAEPEAGDTTNSDAKKDKSKDELSTFFDIRSEVMNGTTSDLVEALQPVTFDQCCIPAVYKDTYNPTDTNCFGTCYNERACNDPTFPFNSAEEKAMFPMSEPSPKGREKLRRACKFPEKLVPSVEWCQKPHVETNMGTAAQLVDGIPPAGCSTVSKGGGSGAFQHVILFPAAKLAFCGIPKVGITQWEQFLRFTFGAKDYPALPHYKLDRDFFQFDLLDPNAQRRIWEDDEWTWAAFIRNPAERLLSAYLDKVAKKPKRPKFTEEPSISFDNFIGNLSQPFAKNDCKRSNGGRDGLNWCSDPHWRPQVYSCGISERLDRFQFIGDLHNAADQTRELLDHVGLWESHGKHFINGGKTFGRNPWCNIVSHPFNHTRHLGFQQKDEDSSAADTVYGHSKGSKDRMEEYFTPELLKKVQEELYPDDYQLWKLVSENGIKLSNGKKLMSKLSSKCAST